MTTLTVNVLNNNDLSVLQEILDRFGLIYSVNKDEEYLFSKDEIDGFLNTKKDFLNGKTTARDLDEILEDMNRADN